MFIDIPPFGTASRDWRRSLWRLFSARLFALLEPVGFLFHQRGNRACSRFAHSEQQWVFADCLTLIGYIGSSNAGIQYIARKGQSQACRRYYYRPFPLDAQRVYIRAGTLPACGRT